MGGSGTGLTRGWLEKLCFHRYGVCARAVRAPVSAEGFIGTCERDAAAETWIKNYLILFLQDTIRAEWNLVRWWILETAKKSGFNKIF